MSADPSGKDAALEAYVDALDHIVRVCHASRTQTRRLRWIAARAKGAIEGNQDWRDLDIPPSADSQSKRVLNLIGQREELSSKLADSQAQSAAYEARILTLESALRGLLAQKDVPPFSADAIEDKRAAWDAARNALQPDAGETHNDKG